MEVHWKSTCRFTFLKWPNRWKEIIVARCRENIYHKASSFSLPPSVGYRTPRFPNDIEEPPAMKKHSNINRSYLIKQSALREKKVKVDDLHALGLIGSPTLPRTLKDLRE